MLYFLALNFAAFRFRRVAGLNAARARKIVEWREKKGAFVNRAQLRGVAGIGEKTFEQCAGFVRVLRETSRAAEGEPE